MSTETSLPQPNSETNEQSTTYHIRDGGGSHRYQTIHSSQQTNIADTREDLRRDVIRHEPSTTSNPHVLPSYRRLFGTRTSQTPNPPNPEIRNQIQRRVSTTGPSHVAAERTASAAPRPLISYNTFMISFRVLLIFLVIFGCLCLLGGLAFGVLHNVKGYSNYLTLTLLFIIVGVIMLVIVAVLWKCTYQSSQCCGSLPVSATTVQNVSSSGLSSRWQCNNTRGPWFGGLLYPEFQNREPPPSYNQSAMEYSRRYRIQSTNTLNSTNSLGSYSLPSTAPPSYRSRISVVSSSQLTSIHRPRSSHSSGTRRSQSSIITVENHPPSTTHTIWEEDANECPVVNCTSNVQPAVESEYANIRDIRTNDRGGNSNVKAIVLRMEERASRELGQTTGNSRSRRYTVANTTDNCILYNTEC